MEKISRPIKFVFTLLATLATITTHAKTQWQTLEPGLDYSDISISGATGAGKLHAFRIDPARYDINLVQAQDFHKSSTSIYQLAHYSDSLVAINGGFFNPDFSPLGLRIQNGKVVNPVKNISWWGIFMIKNHHPEIIPLKQFNMNASIQFAVQAGPRLLVNGDIPHLKPGTDERSALCITKHGKVIIAATENTPVTTTELATILKSNDLDCYNALNLDGGSSTQLYAHSGDFSLSVFSFANIADAVVVKRRI